MDERALIDALSDPSVYPWESARVEHLETHVSQLFFAGDRVVKIKRAVDYGFVNHLTLASRQQSCEDEVRLNRRLSDGVYLGCEPIVRDGNGAPRLGAEGEPVEWATVMRLLPADRMLDALIERGNAPDGVIDAIADRLIPFHQTAGSCPGDAAEQADDAERIVRENLDEIGPFSGLPVFAIEFGLVAGAMRGFLDRHPEALVERARHGDIREGHGDLRCEHICLDPPGAVQIFDCVEFSQSIRCADIASDLAFLLLDLERLGAPEMAARLVDRYRDAGIELPPEMLALYRAHRALVRVKTSALTWASTSGETRDAALDATATWLHRAAASVLHASPVVVAMSGLSGTGKSVVASALGVALGATVISSDQLRAQAMPDDADRYDPARRLDIYRLMAERAHVELTNGRPVVLDATFLQPEQRKIATQLANDSGVPLQFVEVVADTDVAERRIVERAKQGDPARSEATLDVLRQQRRELSEHPVGLPEGASLVRVDTSTDGPVSLDVVLSWLHQQQLLLPTLP